MAGIKDIARRAGLDDELCQRFVDAIGLTIRDGEPVRLIGLGSFTPNERPARAYSTPVMDGRTSLKPAHRTVSFRPSKVLLEVLNPAPEKATG